MNILVVIAPKGDDKEPISFIKILFQKKWTMCFGVLKKDPGLNICDIQEH